MANKRKRHYVAKMDGVAELHYLDTATVNPALLGPFKTKKLAQWYIDNLASNPNIQCVADVMMMYRALKDL